MFVVSYFEHNYELFIKVFAKQQHKLKNKYKKLFTIYKERYFVANIKLFRALLKNF